MTTENQIRKTLDELDQLTGAMWKRQEEWREAHPDEDRPLVCEGVGLVGRCTDTASWLAERLGGVVHGYRHKDNPEAVLGKDEFGHDFVIVSDRWLVDWWARDNYQERDLYDLGDPADRELVRRLYGDPEKWEPVSPGDLTEYRAHVRELLEFDS